MGFAVAPARSVAQRAARTEQPACQVAAAPRLRCVARHVALLERRAGMVFAARLTGSAEMPAAPKAPPAWMKRVARRSAPAEAAAARKECAASTMVAARWSVPVTTSAALARSASRVHAVPLAGTASTRAVRWVSDASTASAGQTIAGWDERGLQCWRQPRRFLDQHRVKAGRQPVPRNEHGAPGVVVRTARSSPGQGKDRV